jgi:hypothetical protein
MFSHFAIGIPPSRNESIVPIGRHDPAYCAVRPRAATMRPNCTTMSASPSIRTKLDDDVRIACDPHELDDDVRIACDPHELDDDVRIACDPHSGLHPPAEHPPMPFERSPSSSAPG